MKKIVQVIGLVTLIGFSFFYTDKVIEVIREEDKIMIEINSVKDTYKIDPVDATVLKNTIIPGLNGRVVDVDASYKNMKSNGVFNNNLMVYETVKPNINLYNNYDKFIILGNNNKQMVSILFLFSNDKYLDSIENILSSKGVSANYFVDYKYLVNHSTKIKELSDREFYSYGDMGKYTPDNLLFSNNLISRISNNNAVYCLSKDMDQDILEMCSKNNLYTVVPNIIGGDNPYMAVKENVSSGSIILFEMNSDTVRELGIIIDYIKGKGLKFGGLSQLLSEELE